MMVKKKKAFIIGVVVLVVIVFALNLNVFVVKKFITLMLNLKIEVTPHRMLVR